MDNLLQCSNCGFFEKLPSREESKISNGGIGNCLANPPQSVLLEGRKRAIAQFPMVLGKMSCGLHSSAK